MVMPLFSIRDVKVGFMAPFCDSNSQSAIRGFHYAIVNKPDLMGFQPADFSLYEIGSFDSESGSVLSFKVPRLLVQASDLVLKDKE